jgi:hypothetical protein
VLVNVLSREHAAAVALCHVEAPVLVDGDDAPGVAVGDVEVEVVAAGGDSVADADALTAGRRHITPGIHLASPYSTRSDGRIESLDLLAGIGDDESGLEGEGLPSFHVGGVDADLAAGQEAVEDLTSSLTTPHQQAEVGVGRVFEPVDDVQGQPRQW